MLNTFLKRVASWWERFFPKKIEEKYMPYQPLEKLPELVKEFMPTNNEKFLKICLDALDTDPSTPDGVKDEVGCAETLSVLIKKIFPDFPILVSTKDLDWNLFSDKRFEKSFQSKSLVDTRMGKSGNI